MVELVVSGSARPFDQFVQGDMCCLKVLKRFSAAVLTAPNAGALALRRWRKKASLPQAINCWSADL